MWVRGLVTCLALFVAPAWAGAQENADCLACHEDRELTTERGGKVVSLFVDEGRLHRSIHADVPCVGCHADLDGQELPHDTPLKPVECGGCHDDEWEQHRSSLHGKAAARGDPLAPRCKTCHGSHEVRAVSDPDSPVATLRIPFLCGGCHSEGGPVQKQREIHQDHILENYSESIHGEGLLKKGLIVAPTCASCHTAHNIRPHTDPQSSISRHRIAQTCSRCHAEIEAVHRKVIKGELWEKQAHVLPACVDCHPPHQIRKVYYDQGMADADCLTCHAKQDLRAQDGRPLFVERGTLVLSAHAGVSCSQCHSEVNASHQRPCETIRSKVDCAACHAEVGSLFAQSIHGQLLAAGDENAPECKECHGTHDVLRKNNQDSPIFPTNIPTLCARCHREGERAAVRYNGPEHEIVDHYAESIHGKGLLKSGLTVTATCANCHTAHSELPASDPRSSVHPSNVPRTCGTCHHGIEQQFARSIHATASGEPGKELPVCSSCHSAHTIRRADEDGFKLQIMDTCGHCHEEIARTYFDTFHGKVSQLGFTKTAKCYDCHGAHDILPPSDPASHLSRQNVVTTCQKCHPGATRRFAGYLTHATHHDPRRYPYLYWTFWGMTTLLLGTFIFGGLHTLLWIPRALQMRRELRREAQRQAVAEPAPLQPDAPPGPDRDDSSAS
jgi:hypothetical protein